MRCYSPQNGDEVRDIVAAACVSGERLEIAGGGRCRDFGRPVRAQATLDLSGLSGVLVYEPAELVLTARAATPLSQINELLRENHQHLAFEPPDLGPLWGQPAGSGTLGGSLLVGLGGSRRATGGAPRDHFLGLKGINGHAQIFGAGGRVVKNVTGFDLPKLFAGSFGTLGVLTEVTIKVMPAPQATLTLAVPGLSAAKSIELLSNAASSAAQASGGAFLSAKIAARSALSVVSGPRESMTLLRLEGFAPSVQWSAAHLTELSRSCCGETPLRIESENSEALWREVTSISCFADGSKAPVWRVSVPPSWAAVVSADIESNAGGACYFDCFGGVIWAQLPFAADGGEAVVRQALSQEGGVQGHATLLRAERDVRERIAPFQPLEPGLAALTRRVKQQFDPHGLFNPGRMYEDD